MEAYFKLLREWISKINEGDTEDVISALDKAVADWNSGKDKKKAINNINHIVSLYGLYDLPNVNGFALMVYEPFQPSDIEWFDGVLEVADTMMEVGLGSEIAQPFYAAAFDRVFSYQGPMESINRTISNGISLAESASTNLSDEFSRQIYKRTEDDYATSANYSELYKLGNSIGMFLGDWAWARGILLQSFEKFKQSSGKPTTQFIHSLTSTLADDCNDVINASKVTRFYIDNHASEFEDFVGLVPLVTDPDYLDDSDLTEEVISKCKELARTYSDWKKLVGRIGEGIYFEKNFISIAKESLSKIENETQKKEFCECHSDCGDAQKDALVAEIRNLSIKQIQERYAAEEDDEEGGFFADLIKDFENNSGSKTNDAKKQEAIAAIKEDCDEFENLEDFHGDKDVVLVAVKEYSRNLKYATEKLRGDKEVVMVAIAQSGFALEHATERLRGDKEVVMAAVADEGSALKHATEKLRGDKEVVTVAIGESGGNLEFASPRLQDDEAVVMAAVQKSGYALAFASQRLKDDEAVVMAAVQQNGHALKFASQRLKDDEAVVMAAVQQDGRALEFASQRLNDDEAVVMAAVQQDGLALEFASQRLKDASGVVQAAMALDANALRYASSCYWSNRELVLRYVANVLDNYGLEDLSELDSDDFESEFDFLDADFVRDVWDNRNGPALKCPSCGKRHIYFYHGVPARDTYYAYEVDPDNGRPGDDVEICPRMDRVDEIRAETFYLCHDCMSSWRTWDECKQACLPESGNSPAVSKETTQAAQPHGGGLSDEKQKAIAAVKEDPSELENLEDFQGDKEVVMAAVTQDGVALEYASEKLQDDEAIVMAAMASNPCALEHANSRFRVDRDLVLRYIQHQLKNGWNRADDLSELDAEQFETDYGFLNPVLVRDVWANRNNQGTNSSTGKEKHQALKCPKCGKRHIYFYQGVPTRDTYYANEVDPDDGRPGEEVEICPRMDRVDEVRAETFYLCHDCMSSWRTWDECKRACLPLAEDKPAVNKETKEQQERATNHTSPALGAEGDRILIYNNTTLFLWDGQMTKQLAEKARIDVPWSEEHEDQVQGILPLPDGRILSWSADNALRLWDGQTGEALAVLKDESGFYWAKQCSDGRILCSTGATLYLWDGQTCATTEDEMGEVLRCLFGHQELVNGALSLPDGRILTWSDDKTLRLWVEFDHDDENFGYFDDVAVLEGHTREVRGAQLLADGRILSWSDDKTLRLWDGQTGKALAVLEGHTNGVSGALHLSDGRILSWCPGFDYCLRMWNGETGKALAVLEGHTDYVKDALQLPDGRILSWSGDKTLRLWDGQTGKALAVLDGHTRFVSGALLLPDGRILSWSGDKTLRLWDGQTGKALAVLKGHTQWIENAPLLLPDGRFLSWAGPSHEGSDNMLRLWDSRTGAALSEIECEGVKGAIVLHPAKKATEEKKAMPAPNTAPANSDDFRAEYSQKIASGELDPAEVSYSSFLATKAKPKELNYRELYSRMISDGKIDPTETTFDEVQTVAKLFLGKDESEFKATYGQGIGSGEIDPASTTYDEIVRVAKYLNEAAKAIAVPPPTTEELKKLYAADIGTGKIDPVEVSFEKFVASYGK
jgi:WD40 repeat protein